MRYLGSKTSTIETIYNLIAERMPVGYFCDPFGGIGTVGSYFQSKGYNIWSGDILTFPYYFQIVKLKFNYAFAFKNLIEELGLEKLSDIANLLNSSPPKKGWFTREYSKNRNFFTNRNSLKIQSCILQIKTWFKKDLIDYDEHAVLLASLINSMDKVANTAGTYYAYLKKWHRKALNEFCFEFIPSTASGKGGNCFLEPAKTLVKRRHFDILYLDPPYNERSYAHYYHLPETIALEKTPKVHGRSGIPINISTISEYNRRHEARRALINLLDNATFDILLFHYADNGIIPLKDIRDILSSFRRVEEYLIEAKGYTTKKTSKKTRHHLYLVLND